MNPHSLAPGPSPEPPPGSATDPAPPALAAVRAAQDRDLGSEGIPMYLALVDVTADDVDIALPPGDSGGDGPAVAAGLDALRAALAATRPDEDLGTVATLLATAAYADFGRRS